jgi:hypothetical protein
MQEIDNFSLLSKTGLRKNQFGQHLTVIDPVLLTGIFAKDTILPVKNHFFEFILCILSIHVNK